MIRGQLKKLLIFTSAIGVISLTSTSFVLANDSSLPATFKPEIPTNEYWDYSSSNGLFGSSLRLYINNTDRDVIYALDWKTGKTVWTVWGKDYGFDRPFEIRQIRNDTLLISAWEKNQAAMTIWVIGADGKVRWQKKFAGYLDMPQMRVLEDNAIFLLNRDSNPASEQGMWKFDLKSGKVLWHNDSKDYYGTYAQHNDLYFKDTKDAFTSFSGGVGYGRFSYHYLVSLKTGRVLHSLAIVNDHEYSQDSSADVVYNPGQKTISYGKAFTRSWYWTGGAKSAFYQLIDRHRDGSVQVYVLGNIILAQEHSGKEVIMAYAFSKKNGSLLWKKSINGGTYTPFDTGKFLVMTLGYASQCENPCHGMVCADDNSQPNQDYSACLRKESESPGFNYNTVVVSNEKTGQVLWQYGSGTWAIGFHGVKLGKENKTLQIDLAKYSSQTEPAVSQTKSITLDLATGKEIK